MDNKITINGLTFVPYITREEIAAQVERVADELRRDLAQTDSDPVFLCVLNGAFIFAADLFRELGIVESKINFVRYSSYNGTSTSGDVKQVMGLTEDIAGKDVVVIEDIVDTGLTATKMVADLKTKFPRSVRFVTLLYKTQSSTTGFRPDYVAFSISPQFIVGYGLDLDGKGRNLKDIYIVEHS